jgi:hypothetical protein
MPRVFRLGHHHRLGFGRHFPVDTISDLTPGASSGIFAVESKDWVMLSGKPVNQCQPLVNQFFGPVRARIAQHFHPQPARRVRSHRSRRAGRS